MRSGLSHPINLAKSVLAFAAISAIAFLSSCSVPTGGTLTVIETGGYQANHGPFDDNGNYIESWADNAPKRRYVSTEKYKALGKKAKDYVRKPRNKPPVIQPRLAAVASPPAVQRQTPKSASTYSRPKSTATASRPKATPPKKSKPSSVAVKPKAKPPIVHMVKKGDTLYGLSIKYKTSIASIQRANKLNSSHIGIGDRLIIPRK